MSTENLRVKGVARDRKNQKWMAKVTVNDRCVFLGRHVSEVSAALAYDHAAVKHFGEYAHPNFRVDPVVHAVVAASVSP